MTMIMTMALVRLRLGLTDRGFYSYTLHTYAETHTHTAPIMLKEDEAVEAVGPAEDEAAARGRSRKRQ